MSKTFDRLNDLEASFQLLNTQAQQISDSVDCIRASADEVTIIKVDAGGKFECKNLLASFGIGCHILQYCGHCLMGMVFSMMGRKQRPSWRICRTHIGNVGSFVSHLLESNSILLCSPGSHRPSPWEMCVSWIYVDVFWSLSLRIEQCKHPMENWQKLIIAWQSLRQIKWMMGYCLKHAVNT